MRRHHLLCTISFAAALAAGTGMAPAAAQAPSTAFAREQAFAIPVGDLRDGISAFSRATGVQLVIAPAAAEGKRTGGVTGTHSVRDALALLLRGTGLQPSIDGAVAVLRPGPIPRRPRAGRAGTSGGGSQRRHRPGGG